MRKMVLYLLTGMCVFVAPLRAAEKKSICLNMIVKNERHVIQRCLESVKPIIDYWIVVDTGSDDGTQEIIREFLKDIPGELHERPWVDFAYNRNEALKLGKDKADYLLFIDADERLVFSDAFRKDALDKDLYMFHVQDGRTVFCRQQLARSSLDWEWKGVLHEQLISTQPGTCEILEGVVNICRHDGHRSQSPLKFQKDIATLEAALREDPGNLRYRFFLAQTYRVIKQTEQSLRQYQKFVEMGGKDQMGFWARYQIGCLQECLNADPSVIIKAYTDAHHNRPWRVEPLSRLACYFLRRGDFLMGYLVASQALSIPPSTDTLFVETWMYDYWLRFQKLICASGIGRAEEVLADCKILLSNTRLPSSVRESVLYSKNWAEAKIAGLAVPPIPSRMKNVHNTLGEQGK